MAQQLFSNSVTHGASSLVSAVALPAKFSSLSISLSSAYAATAATTGVKMQVGASNDGGVTFSDYADVATTAPTPSQGSPVSSQVFASLSSYAGATHLRFKLINLDGTNDATATLTLRAAG